jgi:serine/threonine protein kinase
LRRNAEELSTPASEIADPFDLTRRRPARNGETEALGYRSGEILDQSYVLVRVLSRGPSAAVWVAQDLRSGEQYALKMLRDPSGMVHATERFALEARLLARIRHPNVVQVIEFGLTKWADPYLVMELLVGSTLQELLARGGRMRQTDAVQLLLPIADALACMHAAGILHRDLKPENVMCIRHPLGYLQPKVIDLGIAIELGPDHHITQTGIVLGSPEYLAPERARGKRNEDERSDLWSFCIMLYELIAGRTPFYDPSDATRVLEAVLVEAVPPLSDFGIDDPELDAILARGLQKAPQGRWPDMRALGRALAEWLVRRGSYEDIEGNSLQTSWLSVSSLAPVALDSDVAPPANPPEEYASYRPPTRSWARSALGLGAATLALGSIAVASLQSSGHLDLRSSAATPVPPVETAPVQVVASEGEIDAGTDALSSEDFGVREPERRSSKSNIRRTRNPATQRPTTAPKSKRTPIPRRPRGFE